MTESTIAPPQDERCVHCSMLQQENGQPQSRIVEALLYALENEAETDGKEGAAANA